MEILIYGLPPHEDRSYMEILLSTQCKNKQDIELIKEKAILAGYHSFRVVKFKMEKPNFVNTIQGV
jgi:hypothetical protein